MTLLTDDFVQGVGEDVVVLVELGVGDGGGSRSLVLGVGVVDDPGAGAALQRLQLLTTSQRSVEELILRRDALLLQPLLPLHLLEQTDG